MLLTRVTSDGPEIATSGTVPADGFVPACTEIEPSSPTAPPATADSFATFGPIGTTPLLSLALPDDRSEMESRFADLESSNVRTTIVRGRRAIAVAKGPLCVYGLTTDPISVWEPLTGSTGDECTAREAAQGGP